MILRVPRKLKIFLQLLSSVQNLHFKEILILRSDLFYVTVLDYNWKKPKKKMAGLLYSFNNTWYSSGLSIRREVRKQDLKQPTRLRRTQSIFSNREIFSS